MASSKEVKMTLKLKVDTENNRVRFAEAGKDFVDFLFTILALPVGRLLTGESKVSCLENLYNSVKTLKDIHMQPNQSKEVLLKPKLAVSLPKASLLRTDDDPPASYFNKMYCCMTCKSYVTYDKKAPCQCGYDKKWNEVKIVKSKFANTGESFANTGEEGYVKNETYMVMDELVVEPMPSTEILKKLFPGLESWKDIERDFGRDEVLKLLNATLHSETVLTRVFPPPWLETIDAPSSIPRDPVMVGRTGTTLDASASMSLSYPPPKHERVEECFKITCCCQGDIKKEQERIRKRFDCLVEKLKEFCPTFSWEGEE